MQKRWLIKTPNPKAQVKLCDVLGIHPVIAQLLVNRQIKNIRQAKDFLFGGLSSLHDPFLIKDMDKAIDRIKEAKQKKERILVYGDYDVDGVTSSAILKNALKAYGLNVINYIPHRIEEGYGLNHQIADFAKQKKIGLLISVDCGINAHAEVDTLNQMGIDVIIVDHHEPLHDKLPKAVAVIDPKRKDCSYPFTNLASVGLAFKLSHALFNEVPNDILDLVALGTIADVSELRGENRIFAKEGLKRIEQTQNKGIMALMQVAGIKGKKVKPHSVGFVLGPRINATGRLGSAEKSLRLLLSEDFDEALKLAQDLEKDNRLRQKMQKEIAKEAFDLISQEVNFKEHRVIVLSKEGWHRGVVGIVAARIVDTFYRPTIVISLEDGMGVGSARSIESFHIFEALGECASLLENFGGHEHAAGLTIKKENIDKFREKINDFARTSIKAEDLVPTLEIDCEVPLSSLSMDLASDLEALEPFGEGNPPPIFCSRHLTLKGQPQILGRDTIKFWVSSGQATFQAVGFGMASYTDLLTQAEEFDLVYRLTIDDWNKDPTVQLKIKDIKVG